MVIVFVAGLQRDYNYLSQFCHRMQVDLAPIALVLVVMEE